MKDLYNHIDVAQSLAPATRTANADGSGVDLQGFEGAVIEIVTGTITDGTHTFEVQESDDNTTFTAVDDADLQGTEPVVTNADGNKVYKIGYLGTKRYVRVSVTVSGATSGGAYATNVIKGYARKKPV
jgi:hypothetical protein